MALQLAEIKCEIREIRLSNKPEHMLEISPKGTVPILILEDKIIDESYDIVNWVIEKRNIFNDNLRSDQINLTESLIKKFEGCELEAYLCPAGVWTIGYGHTKDVKEGDRITKDEANHLLEEEMIEYESYIDDMVDVELNQSQYDALCAWVYNLGPSNLGSSQLLKVLNEGKYEEVPQQIKRWNKANGEVLNGLIRRREAEALLFEGKEWHEV